MSTMESPIRELEVEVLRIMGEIRGAPYNLTQCSIRMSQDGELHIMTDETVK